MHFWTIIKFSFHFLFYQLVNSSQYLLPRKNSTFSNKNDENNLFAKFFVDLNKVYLQKHEPWHVTVVWTSADDLQQVQPLLERFPFIICNEAERCTQSQWFNQDNFVVIFLKDLSGETLENNMRFLSHCNRCKFFFLSNGDVEINDVWLIRTLAVKYHIPHSKFAHLGKSAIQLYSDFIATNCTMQVQLATVWRPRIRLNELKKWALQRREMHGCPVSVSTLDFEPKMMIEKNEDGSLKIVGGREGKLLLAIADELNFTVALRYPSMESQLKYSRKLAILHDVAFEISEIGIGRLRPTNNLNNTIALSVAYDEECETWGVPRVMKLSNGIIWVEFSWKVWVLVGLIFSVGCAITYAHRIILVSKNGKKNLGFVKIFLEVFATHLGNPIVYVSTSAGGRFMLVAYLCYATVITTAYKTSLASILATDKLTPKIVDTQGLVNSNLKVGGSLYDYNILYDQAHDTEVTSKLLKRFVINNNNSMPWEILFSNQDTAFLARRSSLAYERQMMFKTQERVTFDILSGCVLSHSTVMALQTRSFLYKPITIIIQHLIESGILDHWDVDEIDTDKILKREGADRYFEKRGSNKFEEIFIFYFVCIATSILTFFLELLVSKLDSKKLRHPLS